MLRILVGHGRPHLESGGAAIFVTNLGVARLIGMPGATGWRTPERLLPAALLAIFMFGPLSLLLPTVPLTILMTTLFAGANGAAVGATISLLLRRYTAQRGASSASSPARSWVA